MLPGCGLSRPCRLHYMSMMGHPWLPIHATWMNLQLPSWLCDSTAWVLSGQLTISSEQVDEAHRSY
jgi:hypothetical protein